MPDDMGLESFATRPTSRIAVLPNPTEMPSETVLVRRLDILGSMPHELQTQDDAIDIIKNYDENEQTLNHCREVAYWVRQAGQLLQWPSAFIDAAYNAAEIHDLGKASSQAIDARGTKRLNDVEKKLFRRQHSEYGAQMMESAGFSHLSVLAARYHHYVKDIPENEQLTDQQKDFLILLSLFDIYSATRGKRAYQDPSVKQVYEQEWNNMVGESNVTRFRPVINQVLGIAA